MVGEGSTCLVVSGTMISWFQCTAFELKAIASLPRELRKRFVAARELQLARELEELPNVTESERSDLESRGIETKLSRICPRLLSERERQVRKRTKESDTETRDAPVTGTVSTRDGHDNREREEKRDKETETMPAANPARRTKAKRRPDDEGEEMPEDWQPTKSHRQFAQENGLNVDREAFGFRGWATGRRFLSVNGRFASWLAKAAKDKHDGPAVKPAIVKGWNDGDMMFGIPKGKTS